MFANVFLKTIRDRWRGWAIAAGVIGSFVLLGMVAYNAIDLSVVDTFPEAYRTLLGLRTGMDSGALAVSAIYGSYGAMFLAAMALAMGAASIAGEERKGTMGLLMANPISRTSVLVSKMAALVVLSVAATVAMWGMTIGSAALAGVALGDLDVPAISTHMLASGLFYGLLALAISAATGNRGAAIGVSVGVMVVGFLGAGLLPLLDGGEDWVKIFPWYYFNGSEPVHNGIDWGHVGLLMGGAAVFAVVALVGVNRRDLKGQSVGVTMVDRLRAFPMTKKVADMLAGGARVSSIWIKTASEHQGSLLAASAYVFLIQLMMGPFFSAIPAETFAVFNALPEGVSVMFELFGGGDLTTPEGFLQIETFGMMAPLMIMVSTISIGSNAIAGEEARRTMGLLLANPISRGRVIAEKALTMVLYACIVGVMAFAGTMLGSLLGDLGMSMWNVASICILLVLVGLVGGGLALAISAGIGRKSAAVWGAVGVMVALHVMNSLGEIAGNPAWQKFSPFYYYLGGDPLNSGLDGGHAAILLALAAVLFGAAFVLVQRRDIREGTE